jgi:hypothetical protein
VQFPEPLSEGILNVTARPSFLPNTSAPINYTLPAFDGLANLGLSIDKDYTLNVFYIGTNRKMYQLYSWYGAWDFATNQSESVWPLADDPNAPFAIAYDQSSLNVRIYYFSNNTLMEIGYYNDATWHDATPVQAFNASAIVAPIKSTPKSTVTPTSSSGGGLTSGAKAGVGVGVSLSLLALIGGAMAFFYVRRQRRRDAQRNDTLRIEASGLLPMNAVVPNQQDNSLAPYSAYPDTLIYRNPLDGNPPLSESKSSVYMAAGSARPTEWEKDAHGDMQTPAEMDSADVSTGMGFTRRPIREVPGQRYHELTGEGRVVELNG